MSYRIQLRRDTAAHWTSVNPVLNQGEPAFETDTGKLKIGDGNVSWSSLAYFTGVSPYTLPVATNSVLGGVKQGTNVSIAVDGTLSVATGAGYTLPTASTSILGGVKVDGASITISSGIISAAQYTLPVATNSVLGGVKQGTNVSIAVDGTLSVATGAGYSYTLPLATTTVLGGVKIDNSTITVNGIGQIVAATYTLPTASTTILGGVKIDNSTITINSSGQIVAATYTLPTASTTVLGGVKVDGSTISLNGNNQLVANYSTLAALAGATFTGLVTFKQTVDTFTSVTISANAVTLNFNNGAIFTLGANTANITANFTNIPTTAGQIISTTLIITQGSTPYIPSVVTINGGGNITPKWQGGSAPSGTANHIDIISIIFICTSINTFTTIGALVDYN
jgi:hypothetical protein